MNDYRTKIINKDPVTDSDDQASFFVNREALAVVRLNAQRVSATTYLNGEAKKALKVDKQYDDGISYTIKLKDGTKATVNVDTYQNDGKNLNKFTITYQDQDKKLHVFKLVNHDTTKNDISILNYNLKADYDFNTKRYNFNLTYNSGNQITKEAFNKFITSISR